ncbi:DUF1223 domain-containing protein [Novosphingobium lentum]|uniref:DUF1223 domain-containing protein n=1 Tax=Novosphingobium lentum TaxID=145287 RepID=UPI000A06B6CB
MSAGSRNRAKIKHANGFCLKLTILLPLLAAGFSTSSASPAPQGHGLQVVELFQSQGCSSCPPANANVMAPGGRPDVLTLSWQVTYWDYLGCKDSFAQPVFTQRQHEYARALGHDGVRTPQVVVNARGDVVGANQGELDGALRKSARGGDAISLVLGPGKVVLSGAATSPDQPHRPQGHCRLLLTGDVTCDARLRQEARSQSSGADGRSFRCRVAQIWRKPDRWVMPRYSMSPDFPDVRIECVYALKGGLDCCTL